MSFRENNVSRIGSLFPHGTKTHYVSKFNTDKRPCKFSTLVKIRVVNIWYKCIFILKKKTKLKPPMLTERIMPTQAHADDIKKLPDIYIYIYIGS